MSLMNLKVLFIQRKENYEGEHAPEALCCVDEWADAENSEWFEKECKNQLKLAGDDDVVSKVIEVEVDQDKIRDILINQPTIKGEIKCL